jgi:two-component system OmpR family response regulator
MHVLLVEHHLPLAKAIMRGLEEEGIDAHLARNDAEGEARARSIAYAALLVDWRVPHRGGAALVRAWRQDGVRTPTIMLMPSGSVPDLVEGFDAGADDFLAMPFSFADLLARLRALQPAAWPASQRLASQRLARSALAQSLAEPV